MYQILCDDYILYDPRDDDLVVLNPKCKLSENTVGEGSFGILSDHPHFSRLQKLKSIFEIRQDGEPIFRGRMTGDSRNFHNTLTVDLEGVLGFTNDTLIPPFNFPDDFTEAENAENVVEYFLGWILDQHNAHAEEWQKLKLGNVTVSDPNNYISRSSEAYVSTWETLKTKLFDSSLGGYLLVRYESDGNYVDYVDNFELTNTQRITFGENLLDIINDSDASDTCTAILPIGKDGLTLVDMDDGDLTGDLVKDGLYIYSKSAVESYGWICVPVNESTWNDVTSAENLQTKAIEYLTGTAVKLSGTITIKAVDLHFTDTEIQSFRLYRNVLVDSPVHGVSGASYRLSELSIDIFNPQNTIITIGDTFRSLTDVNERKLNNATQKVESTVIALQEKVENIDIDSAVSNLHQTMIEQNTTVLNTAETIILSALESYVESSNFEEFQETIQAQFQMLADEMTLQFTETTQRIENVDGDLQAKFNQIVKYFTFEIDGMTIGQVDNPNKVVIDNDEISILVNGTVVQRFDASGKALIPELKVTRAFNLFGYLIDQDEEGRVNCEYAGGDG